MATEVLTASDVIDKLGGTGATARLTNKSIQAVSNWRATGKIPADTYLVMQAELGKLKAEAAPSIWGIVEPLQAAS